MKETKVKKENKGITLIALVITIIVLLILASISIATLTGENGILTKANSGREETIVASEKEAINLALIACKTKNYKNIAENIVASQLQTELNKNGHNATVIDSDTNLVVTFEETKNKYIVEQNGQIIAEGEAKETIISAGNYGGKYLYWETATGEVNILTWENGTGFYSADKEGSSIVTTNGIKDIGEFYILDKKGKLYLIGYNDNGQLGNGTTETSYVPICINDIEGNLLNGKNIVQVIHMWDGVIVLDDEGKMYAWGNNENGIFGNGTLDSTTIPLCISDIDGHIFNGKKITQIVTVGYSIFAIDDKGKIYTWGKNEDGQLGNGTMDNKISPICISDIEGSGLKDRYVTEIQGFNRYEDIFIYALDNEGKVYSWGGNEDGQLGNGTTDNSTLPKCISDIDGSDLKNKTIKSINLEYDYVYGLDENGKVYTWGANGYGQLGNGTTDSSILPICISDIDESDLKGKNIIQINKGDSNIVLDENGKVYTWGLNRSDDLGNGTSERNYMPKCISDIEGSVLKNKNIIQILNKGNSMCVMDDKGKVYMWGSNYNGELGVGSEENTSNVPICINDEESSLLYNKEIKWIQYNQKTLYALDKEGKAYIWGSNYSGQLGDGITDDSNLPICLSDDENNILYNKKVKKIIYTYSSTDEGHYIAVIYITENNEIYYFTYEEQPT